MRRIPLTCREFCSTSSAAMAREHDGEGLERALRRAVKKSVSEGCRDADRWRRYSVELQQFIPSLGAADVCFYLSAFAIGKVQDINLTTQLCAQLDAIEHWPRTVAASDLKKLIIAFGRSKVFDSDLMRTLAPTIIDRVEEFNPRDVCHLIYAYARVPVADGDLFSMAASVLPSYVCDLRPTEIAHVAEAFASVSMYDEQLFDSLANEVTRRLRDFGAADLLTFFDALSTLNARMATNIGAEDYPGLRARDDEELWEAFTQQVKHMVGSYSLQDLVKLLVLFQRENRYENRLVHHRLLPVMKTQLDRADRVAFESLGLTLQCLARLPWQSEVSVDLCYDICRRLHSAQKPKKDVAQSYLLLMATLEALKVDPETRNYALGEVPKGHLKAEDRAMLSEKLQLMENPPKSWLTSLKETRPIV